MTAAECPIEQDVMLGSINAAHQRLCPAATNRQPTSRVATGNDDRLTYIRPNLVELAGALKELDPDCEEPVWALRRMGPLALEAQRHPDMADDIRALAFDWSSGRLAGVPSHKWSTPASNGIKGADAIGKLWDRFMRPRRSGVKSATVRTIYYDAVAARRARLAASPSASLQKHVSATRAETSFE